MKALKIIGTVVALMVILALYGEFIQRHGNPIAIPPVASATPATAAAHTQETNGLACARVAYDLKTIAFNKDTLSQADAHKWIDTMPLGDIDKEVYHRTTADIYAHPELDSEAIGYTVQRRCLEELSQ